MTPQLGDASGRGIYRGITPTDITPMNIQPLGDFYIIKPDPAAEEQRVGGLYIPPTNGPTLVTGRVVSVHPAFTTDNGAHITPIVEVGDQVYYRKGAGIDFTDSGESFVYLRRGELIAVVIS